MHVSPLLIEGAWMTISGRIPIFQQRLGEMNSSSDSHKRHDRGTRAEGAGGGKVAKWPCGGKRGQKGWNLRKTENKSSQGKWREHKGQLKGKHLVRENWRGVAGWKRPPFTEKKLSEMLFLPRSSHWWPVSQNDFSSPNLVPAEACLQTMCYSIYSASELHLTDVSSIPLHVSSSGAKFCKRLAS